MATFAIQVNARNPKEKIPADIQSSVVEGAYS